MLFVFSDSGFRLIYADVECRQRLTALHSTILCLLGRVVRESNETRAKIVKSTGSSPARGVERIKMLL